MWLKEENDNVIGKLHEKIGYEIRQCTYCVYDYNPFYKHIYIYIYAYVYNWLLWTDIVNIDFIFIGIYI